MLILLNTTKKLLKRTKSINYAIKISIILCFVLIFSLISYSLGSKNLHLANDKDAKLSFLEAVYYTVITITTTGYGDIYPVTDLARIIKIVEIVLFIILMGLF